MNWPQIRQGQMLLKGTQFTLLQLLAETSPRVITSICEGERAVK